MPSSVFHDTTPYNVLFPTKPLFPIKPRIFGSTCYAHDFRPQVTKLDPKSLKYIFLGYSRLQKEYRCYCPNINKYLDLLVYHIIYQSTNVTSSPTTPTPLPPLPIRHVYSRRRNTLDACSVPAASWALDPMSSDLNLPIALRKGKRQYTYPISFFVSYDHLSPSSCSFVASLDSVTLPKTVHEALSNLGWREAMIEEMNALDANGTWDLVDLPAKKKGYWM
ncbi:uncharacterized protein LOC111378870 [Olea europaea var. sylvestris]|uniref:uncharacterized protein LOC111378870 n=1 Tax=Olea europaea var. sylvestris TaxID=158386 RepID=UPI000C1D6AA7|nr:uncharacterized protein LOC111378870 [Olea europaea var. sylvestris]